jgi:hypothetical protein
MGRGLGLDQQLGWLGAWRHDLEDGPRRACSNQPAAGGRRRQQRRHRQQPTCCSTRHTAPPPSRHAEANRVQGGVIRPKPTASPSWSGMPGRWPRANLHRGRRAISSNAHHAATPPTTDGHSMLRSVRLVDLTHAGRDGPRPPPDNPRDTRAPTRRSWAGGVAVANRKHVWSRAGSPTMVPRAAHQRRRPIHACRCRSSRPTCTGSGEARPVDGARPPHVRAPRWDPHAGQRRGPRRHQPSLAEAAPPLDADTPTRSLWYCHDRQHDTALTGVLGSVQAMTSWAFPHSKHRWHHQAWWRPTSQPGSATSAIGHVASPRHHTARRTA